MSCIALIRKLLKESVNGNLSILVKKYFKIFLCYLGINTSKTYILYADGVKERSDSGLASSFFAEIYYIHELNSKHKDFLLKACIDYSLEDNFIVIFLSDKINNTIISYAFAYFSFFKINRFYGFKLENDECFISPVWVNPSYRGKQINYQQLSLLINYLLQMNYAKFITCIRTDNFPSLKSFYNVGFSIIGVIEYRKIINKLLKLNIYDFTQDRFLTYKVKGRNVW